MRAVADSVPSKLIDVLVKGSLAEALAFAQSNGAALQAAGVNVDAAVTKARLLALAAVCNERLATDVAYADIAKAIQVPEADVEKWLVDGASRRGQVRGVANLRRWLTAGCTRHGCCSTPGVRYGLIDVRMNQLKNTAFVSYVAVATSTLEVF